MELAARLREEALVTNERRMLVLSGEYERTRQQAVAAIDRAGIDDDQTSYIGPDPPECGEHVPFDRTGTLLGTTRAAVIVDCHTRCEPNVLGTAAGAVDGGGLLILCTPPLSQWPDHGDAFDETLAPPPYDPATVGGHFRRRLGDTLRSHRGIAIVDVDTGTVHRDGHIDYSPGLSTREIEIPQTHTFPTEAYDSCLTQDQVGALASLEALCDAGQAVVLEAHRGRGKSSVAGLACASLAVAGHDILVTAPQYRNVAPLFERAGALLHQVGARRTTDSDGSNTNSDSRSTDSGGVYAEQTLETPAGGRIRYCPPPVATALPQDPDRVVVDEAAACSVAQLRSFLRAPSVAYITTFHGYEGSGRGFSVRFREHLADSAFEVSESSLAEPIRFASGDPIEVWSFRALLLDARPPVAELVTDATPDTVHYRVLDSEQLCADEWLLRSVFGLLVLAHYRTEPNDLARLLDAPNVSVHALCHEGWPVTVALLAREGGLDDARCRHIYTGGAIRGNLIPDLLSSQLRDEDAGAPVGHRILRIATHAAVRSRGLGSLLVDRIRGSVDEDWIGVAFGATPRLVRFWDENGFSAVHLGSSRDDRSGEHSAVMMTPQSSTGETLVETHEAWFRRRLPGMLTDSLNTLDPDVIRALTGTAPAAIEPELSPFEWKHAAGLPFGAAVFSTAPRTVRRLTLVSLFDGDSDDLTVREQRLLVMKALQGRSTNEVRHALSFDSEAACMRALGDAVEPLVERYGDEVAREELARLR